MPRPGSLIVIHFLQPLQERTVVSRRNYPLHLTVVPWFRASGGIQENTFNTVENLVKNTPPFKFKIGNRAMFGPDNDVPVNLVSKNQRLKELHLKLATALEAAGAVIESEYVKAAYRPHISHNQTEQAYTREAYSLNSLTFLKLLPDKTTCQAVRTYFLEGQQ